MRQVIYSREAARVLQRVPANMARLIREKVLQLAADPRSLANNVRALKGRDGYYRLRVGNWRVVFREDGAVVDVVEVGPRGSIYD